jgi:hypothetical protein
LKRERERERERERGVLMWRTDAASECRKAREVEEKKSRVGTPENCWEGRGPVGATWRDVFIGKDAFGLFGLLVSFLGPATSPNPHLAYESCFRMTDFNGMGLYDRDFDPTVERHGLIEME